MDDETRAVLVGVYQQLRHNHERMATLTGSISALVAAMERTDPAFQVKYAAAMKAELQSERALKDSLGLQAIDAAILLVQKG